MYSTVKEYYVINSTGYDSLLQWLRGVLKEPEHAEAHADAMTDEFDGGSVNADQIVEVRGMYTRTGNPATYRFDKADELDLLAYEHEED